MSRSVSGRLMPFSALSLLPWGAAWVISTLITPSALARMWPPILPSSNQIGWPGRAESKTASRVQGMRAGASRRPLASSSAGAAGRVAAGEQQGVAYLECDGLKHLRQGANGALGEDVVIAIKAALRAVADVGVLPAVGQPGRAEALLYDEAAMGAPGIVHVQRVPGLHRRQDGVVHGQHGVHRHGRLLRVAAGGEPDASLGGNPAP